MYHVCKSVMIVEAILKTVLFMAGFENKGDIVDKR